MAPWAEHLADILASYHHINVSYSSTSLGHGDLCFLLGCTEIIPSKILQRHRLNLVVHESDLPYGKGWSPVQWQVLEGKSIIPITLFQATETPDDGPVYIQDSFSLNGTELLPEIRYKQGQKTLEIILEFLERWPNIEPQQQSGQPTFYRRRTRKDDRLDVNEPLSKLFNQLRIANNDEYPAWFEYKGKHYHLKIFNSEDPP